MTAPETPRPWLTDRANLRRLEQKCATLAARCEALERERDDLAGKLRIAQAAIALRDTEAEALAARVRSLEEALLNIAEWECYTREGEEPPHIRIMEFARATLTREEGK